MNALLSFSPEPFADLDKELNEFESTVSELENDEADEEVRKRSRTRPSRGTRSGIARSASVIRNPQGRILPPPTTPSHTLPRLSRGLRTIPVRRLIPAIPFIPPLIGLPSYPLPLLPRDVPPADDNQHTEQATKSEGSGNPPTTQASEEPGSEYIRWVQDCLNRTLGLQLPVDGIMTRETRSAVRSFQERQGLPITGLIGPETEKALKTTLAGSSATTNNVEPTPEAEEEGQHPASGSCPSCDRRSTMNYQLSFEPELFAGNTVFEDFETLDTEAFEEFQGAISMNSIQRARWIQESLNKILGLQLNVDGVIGSQTRSAIRSFQQKKGLVADGIVGPNTEAAVIAALPGAHRPQDLLPYTTPALLTPPVNQSIQQTIYGWNQYKRQIEELPPDQRAVLKGVGDAIIASYKPGGQPVGIVKVYGHADWDIPRNPKREQQMSDERAGMVTTWLKNYVGSSIADRIIWDKKGLGATELKAQPTMEEKRKRNRRVEVLAIKRQPISGYPPHNCLSPENRNKALISWVQSGLNRVLNLRLQPNGVMRVDTRSALRLYQQRKGLHRTGGLSSTTLRALQLDGNTSPPPCAGIIFGIGIGNYSLYKATQLVVEDIIDCLKRYFGIATNWTHNNDGYFLCVSQPTTEENKQKIGEADAHWDNVKAEIATRNTEPSSRYNKIKILSKFRDWIITWLQGHHNVKIGTSVEAFRTWGRGAVIDGNPFTWWVRQNDSQVYIPTMSKVFHTASSKEAQTTMGPLMLLLHEAEHDTGKRVDGTTLTGAGDVMKEENDVIRDIDQYAGVHPFLVPRFTYEVSHCKYTSLVPSYMTRKRIGDVEPSPPIEWIKWPCAQEFIEGKRT